MSSLATLPLTTLAQRSGIPVDAIRSYERLGLLSKPRRVAGGLMLYASDDMEKVRFIHRALALGFSVSAVRDMLGFGHKKPVTCCQIYAIAARHLEDIRRRKADLTRMEAALTILVEDCPRELGVTSCSIVQALSHPPSGC
jgi:MerR family mercuric resistance operon transcriptional regulator